MKVPVIGTAAQGMPVSSSGNNLRRLGFSLDKTSLNCIRSAFEFSRIWCFYEDIIKRRSGSSAGLVSD